MTFPGSFCLIIAFALQASRACRLPLWQSLETPLTPAAALAFFPRSAARKDVYEGAKYTMFLTLPITRFIILQMGLNQDDAKHRLSILFGM
jgi:hypothetical protein